MSAQDPFAFAETGLLCRSLLISDSDLFVDEHRGQILQCQAIFTYVYHVMQPLSLIGGAVGRRS
jgi:hypothetical protein